MTTLDRPSIIGFIGLVPDCARRLRCSIFTCAPRYRIVRAVKAAAEMKTYAHPGLRRLLAVHWQTVRKHSSWSRA